MLAWEYFRIYSLWKFIIWFTGDIDIYCQEKSKKVEYNIKKSNFSFSSEFIYLFKVKTIDLKLKLKI